MELRIGNCYDKNGNELTENQNFENHYLAEFLSDILSKRHCEADADSGNDKQTA